MAKLAGAFLKPLVVKQFAVNELVQRERCDLYSGVVRFESVIIVPVVSSVEPGKFRDTSSN
jgi:hypothetical protein